MRYLQWYGGSANLELTSFDWTFFADTWTTTDTALNANAENKFIKKAHPQKSLATAQNTLSFFLPTHKPAQKKMKECFLQLFDRDNKQNETLS